MAKIKKAIIPCAGYGTRFLPITKVVPKELLPIGNKPAIQYVVEEAMHAGIEEVILVCHPDKLSIVDYFKRDQSLIDFLKSRGKHEQVKELLALEKLADFRVVYQREALGLGHAILCAEEAVGKDPYFLVMLPDVLVVPYEAGAPELVQIGHKQNNWGLLLEKVLKTKISSYGIVGGKIGKKGFFEIESAVEKPRADKAPSDYSILGRYLLPHQIFEQLKKLSRGILGEVQLTDAIHQIASRKTGVGVICRTPIYDVGIPQGLAQVSSYFQHSL